MQTTDAGLVFQTTRQLNDAAHREKKLVAADKVGRPIRISSKILDMQCCWPDAWTAESGWVARRLDLETGDTKRIYRGHQGPVTSVQLCQTSEGLLLITSSWDKTIRIWDAASGKQIHVLEGHSDFVKSIMLIPLNPARLISTSSDRTFRCWDISATPMTKPTAELPVKLHTRPVECSAWKVDDVGQDGVLLWTADSMGVICEWKLVGSDATFLKRLEGHETSISQLQVDESGLWSVSMDKSVKYHPFDGSPTMTIAQSGYVKAVCPATIGKQSVVLTGGDDEDIWVWDTSRSRSQPIAKVPGHCGEITTILTVDKVNDAACVVVTASLDGTIRRWTASDLLEPSPLQYDTQEKSSLTEDEERELAELMADD